MKKEVIKRYACFTEEQQAVYEGLPARQRAYVNYRAKGHTKSEAYRMAGYDAKRASQSAWLLESHHPKLADLVQCLQRQVKVREIEEEDSALNQQIDALALQQGAEKALEVIEGADGETAKRIQFYRDVMNGRIKTVRKTVRKNKAGEVIETKIEEVSDVDTKMRARKELDKILGLTEMPDLGALQMGDITIHIVDASRREEVEDERNKVELNPDDVVEVDGEKVLEVKDGDGAETRAD